MIHRALHCATNRHHWISVFSAITYPYFIEIHSNLTKDMNKRIVVYCTQINFVVGPFLRFSLRNLALLPYAVLYYKSWCQKINTKKLQSLVPILNILEKWAHWKKSGKWTYKILNIFKHWYVHFFDHLIFPPYNHEQSKNSHFSMFAQNSRKLFSIGIIELCVCCVVLCSTAAWTHVW